MTAQEEEKPTSNSLCNILIQGLQSKDSKLVSTVLDCQEDDLIKGVLEILPANHVRQFVMELKSRLTDVNSLRWLQELLVVKFSVLSSMPNVATVLSQIMEQLDDKCSLDYYQKLLMLKGKMDLMNVIREDRRNRNVDPVERAVISLRARIEKNSDDEAMIDLDSEDDE